jgi:hypothetical protein
MDGLFVGVVLQVAAVLVDDAVCFGRVGNGHDGLVAADIERTQDLAGLHHSHGPP